MHALAQDLWEGKHLFPWDVQVVALSYCKEHTVPCANTAVTLNLSDEMKCMSHNHHHYCTSLDMDYQSCDVILSTVEGSVHDEVR